MSIELQNVSSLSADEIAESCSDCQSMLFAESGPRDTSSPSIDRWLSELKSAEKNGDELRYVLWEFGNDCGPITVVRINRVFAELDWTQLKCYYTEPSLHSGLAAAACQAAISHAFEGELTSRIVAKVLQSDSVTRSLYSSIPLTVIKELTALSLGSFCSVPFEIRKSNPIWRTWEYDHVLSDAESRLRAEREFVNCSEDLMDVSRHLKSQVA